MDPKLRYHDYFNYDLNGETKNSAERNETGSMMNDLDDLQWETDDPNDLDVNKSEVKLEEEIDGMSSSQLQLKRSIAGESIIDGLIKF